MRLKLRDRRNESFFAKRLSNGSGASAGGAWRNMQFDTVQSDKTDGKILFIPNTTFQFTAKENEVWHFSVAVWWFTASALSDQLGAGVQHSAWGTIALDIKLAEVAGVATHFMGGSITLPCKAGDTMTPIAYSANATNNNIGGQSGSGASWCSGYRVA